jgi:hypothetical protein
MPDEEKAPPPESTNALLHNVLARLDELGDRVRRVEELLIKDRFEAGMDQAAEQGQRAALDPGLGLG